jgi:hypothetical protein
MFSSIPRATLVQTESYIILDGGCRVPFFADKQIVDRIINNAGFSTIRMRPYAGLPVRLALRQC